MKLLLLKTLLQRRVRDDGYVLPMVIAIGLVMMLLGIVNMTSAKEENFNAIIQNSRSDALGIAEVGIARYREMLSRNRVLTVYNHDQWTAIAPDPNPLNVPNVLSQSCDVITDTAGGWAYTEPANSVFNLDNWRSVILDETILNRDFDNDGSATNSATIIGSYQLVSYEYDIDGNIGDTDNDGVIDDTDDNGVFSVVSDANTDDDAEPGPPPHSITDENDTNDDGISDARGILTVKGRTLDGSTAQIQVQIPLRINQQDMNNLAPALWIGNGNTGNLGGLVVGDSDGDNITDDLVNNFTGATGVDGIPDVNIVVSDPNDGTNPGCRDIASVNNNTIVTDPRNLPPIDAITQTIADAQAATGDRTNNFAALEAEDATAPLNLNFLGALNHDNYNPDSDPATFDPNLDCAVARDCRYYYTLPAIIGNRDYRTDGVAKVTLYRDGDLAINAGGSDMTIGSDVSSNYLEIYSTGNIEINTDGNNVTIDALIHTPGTFTITGGGTVTINGSVLAGDFNNTIGTLGAVKINPDNTDSSSTVSDKSYKFYTTISNRTPRPLTGSPTNWQTEEVN